MNEEIKIQMIMVCQKHGEPCNEEGCVIEVGDKVHLFCCSKGFEHSLEDFKKSLNNMTTTAKTIPYQSRNIYLSELSDVLSDFHFTVGKDIPRLDIKAGKRYHVKYDEELGYWFGYEKGWHYLADIDQESLNMFIVE